MGYILFQIIEKYYTGGKHEKPEDSYGLLDNFLLYE